MSSRWLVYAVLAAAIVSLLVLFWQSLAQVRETQQHVAKATLATAWPLYQANSEVERFRAALARHVANDPTVIYDDVLLRFDILMSRVPLIDTEVTLQIRWRGLTPKGLKVRAQAAMAKVDGLLAARDDGRGALDLVADTEAILVPINRALTGLLVDFQNEQNRLYASTKRSLADLVRHRNALIVAVFGLILLLLGLSFMDMRRARRAEARFKAFAGSGSDWLWETDQRGRLTFASPGWEKTFGDPPTGDGRSSTDRIDAAMAEKAELRALVARRAPFRDVRCEIATATGETRTVELAGVPVHGRHGRFEGYRGVATDITEKLGQERRIQYLAEHDALTDLRNRTALLARLDALLDHAGQTPPPIVLLALDLDGFKAINDALGHDVGDQLLAAVASRLSGAARQGDVIARFGGDEFAILQHGETATETTAVAIAARIIERLSRPFAIDGQLIQVGVSIGIAVCPDHDATGAGLIKAADLALYRAKQDGRNCYRVYSASMGEQLHRRRQIEVALRKALRNDEIELHYQPLVRLADRRVVSVEALARWQHGELGPIGPAEFVPVAEATGLILPLGRHVLRTACRAAAAWTGPMADVGVAVNLSIAQLAQAGLVEEVQAGLVASGLAPERLTLEITETMLMADPARGIRILEELRALGVQLAIDDFGTGYSSLTYLRRFPVGKVKLDRSFIANIASREDERHIVSGVISMVHSLGLTVVAEGAETKEQHGLLRELQCDEVQGYLFGRPMPIERLLARAGAAEPVPIAAARSRSLEAAAS